MTTAREIIRGALSYHLNALSPGEAEDADLFGRCLEALNACIDDVNAGPMLWRQYLVPGTVTGAFGTLGTTWPVVIGSSVLGATYSDGLQAVPIQPITMEQYHYLPIKTTAGQPQYYAYDGGLDIFFYPAPTGQEITLRTMYKVPIFLDLDTDYGMPDGYKVSFQALLAEKMAYSLLGEVPAFVTRAAKQAKIRLKAKIEPEIIGGTRVGNILTGFR